MFNYNEYKNIIKLIRSHLPIVDFSEVTDDTKKFCILRHDIEFSIDRAYELAKIEWSSSHYWLIGDTLGYIVHQNWTLNDNGYLYLNNDHIIWYY